VREELLSLVPDRRMQPHCTTWEDPEVSNFSLARIKSPITFEVNGYDLDPQRPYLLTSPGAGWAHWRHQRCGPSLGDRKRQFAGCHPGLYQRIAKAMKGSE